MWHLEHVTTCMMWVSPCACDHVTTDSPCSWHFCLPGVSTAVLASISQLLARHSPGLTRGFWFFHTLPGFPGLPLKLDRNSLTSTAFCMPTKAASATSSAVAWPSWTIAAAASGCLDVELGVNNSLGVPVWAGHPDILKVFQMNLRFYTPNPAVGEQHMVEPKQLIHFMADGRRKKGHRSASCSFKVYL